MSSPPQHGLTSTMSHRLQQAREEVLEYVSRAEQSAAMRSPQSYRHETDGVQRPPLNHAWFDTTVDVTRSMGSFSRHDMTTSQRFEGGASRTPLDFQQTRSPVVVSRSLAAFLDRQQQSKVRADTSRDGRDFSGSQSFTSGLNLSGIDAKLRVQPVSPDYIRRRLSAPVPRTGAEDSGRSTSNGSFAVSADGASFAINDSWTLSDVSGASSRLSFGESVDASLVPVPDVVDKPVSHTTPTVSVATSTPIGFRGSRRGYSPARAAAESSASSALMAALAAAERQLEAQLSDKAQLSAQAELLSSTVNQLRSEIDVLKAQLPQQQYVRELEDKIAALTVEQQASNECFEINQQLEARLAEAAAAISIARKEQAESKLVIATLQNEKNDAEARVRALSLQLEDLNAQLDEEQTGNDDALVDLKATLDHMRTVCESQTTSLAQSNAKCEVLSQELISVEAELTSKTTLLQEVNRELDDTRQGLTEAVSLIGSLQNEARLSHEEVALLKARLEGENAEVMRQQAKFAELSSHFNRKCEEVVALSMSLDASRSQLTYDRLNTSHRGQEDRLVLASPPMDRVSSLERMVGEKDAELEVCQARLEALRRRVANTSGSFVSTDYLSVEACSAVHVPCECEGLIDSVAKHELASKIAQAKVDLLEGRVLSLHRELSEKRTVNESCDDVEVQCDLITVEDDLRTMVARLEVQLAEAVQTAKQTEARHANSDSVIYGLTLEVEMLRGSCSQKDGFIASLQASLEGLAAEAEDSAVALRESKAECDGKTKLLAVQADEAEAAVLEFAEMKAELEGALEACQSEVRALKSQQARDKEAWMEQLNDLQLTANARVADAVAEAEKFRAQADRYRLDYEANSDRVSVLKAEVDEVTAMNSEITSQLIEAKRALRAAHDQMKTLLKCERNENQPAILCPEPIRLEAAIQCSPVTSPSELKSPMAPHTGTPKPTTARTSLSVQTEALLDESTSQPSADDVLQQRFSAVTAQLAEKCEQLQAAHMFVAEIQGQLAALQAQAQTCATEVSQVASTSITPSYTMQTELQELQARLQQSQQHNRNLMDTIEQLEHDKVALVETSQEVYAFARNLATEKAALIHRLETVEGLEASFDD